MVMTRYEHDESQRDDYPVNVKVEVMTDWYPEPWITEIQVMYSEIAAVRKLLLALNRNEK